MTFGQKLSSMRKENNYTQEQLADILGVSRQSVSKWESDTAYPETDKLISLSRLFDCSLDYLLKDECSNKNNVTVNATSNHHKIIGYILLTVSLLAGLLAVLLSQTEEQIFILLPIILAVFACAIVCLSVKKRAEYWCIWAAVSPVTLICPFIIGLSLLNRINVIAMCFYVIMFFYAKRVFDKIPLTSKSTLYLSIGWGAWFIVRIASYFLITSRIIDSVFDILPYMFLNLIIYVGVAVLITFTARIKRQ